MNYSSLITIGWANKLAQIQVLGLALRSTLFAPVTGQPPYIASSAGAKLFFLPKYSPDLNLIEQVFAKIKHFLRKAAARTVEAVCDAIGEILQAFTPEECAASFTNSGYR